MLSFILVSLLGYAFIGCWAAPTKQNHQACMSEEQASVVAAKYGELIASYTDELAEAILTLNFTDTAESVNTLIDSCPEGSAAITLPLLAATFVGRGMFEHGQGQQPPINFKRLNMWTSCNAVIIRWETTNTANITGVKPIIGLIAMETVEAPVGSMYPWLIDTVYSEFDSGAWLQNLEAAGICSGSQGLPDPTPTSYCSRASLKLTIEPTNPYETSTSPSSSTTPVNASELNSDAIATAPPISSDAPFAVVVPIAAYPTAYETPT